MRRDSDAATGVGAEAERRTQAATIADLAAAAAAGGPGEVIGIVGAPVDEIVGSRSRRRVRGHWFLPRMMTAGGAKARQPKSRRALGTKLARTSLVPRCRLTPFVSSVILDCHRYAIAADPLISPRASAASALVRLFPCRIGRELDDGIELRIDLRDLLEMRLHNGPGAELLGADLRWQAHRPILSVMSPPASDAARQSRSARVLLADATRGLRGRLHSRNPVVPFYRSCAIRSPPKVLRLPS